MVDDGGGLLLSPIRSRGASPLTGAHRKQARLYAQQQIGVDLTNVAAGKTYSQVSDEWIAGGMKSAKLAGERTRRIPRPALGLSERK